MLDVASQSRIQSTAGAHTYIVRVLLKAKDSIDEQLGQSPAP